MRLACSWSQQIKSEIGLTCEACAWIPQVAQGIIWVWGENGPDAALESAVTPAPLIPELDDAGAVESGRVTAGAIYPRDLPYSWETFIENVVVNLCVVDVIDSPVLTASVGGVWSAQALIGERFARCGSIPFMRHID